MRLLVMTLILFGLSAAQAEVIFSPAITYSTTDVEEANVTTADRGSMVADLRLGYLHASGLFLGGMYSLNDLVLFNDDDSGSSVGPTIGFSHYSGFYALFTYFIIAEKELQGREFTDGSGPQVDLGWVFPLTANFSLGPQLTYKSVTFDKLKTGGVETSVESTVSTINPYISLWFRF